jgi:hypothetical protein
MFYPDFNYFRMLINNQFPTYRCFSTTNTSIPRSGKIQGPGKYPQALYVPKGSCVGTSSWI